MNYLVRKLKSPSLKNILWVLLGYGIKQGSQFFSFILLVRTIGVEGFGAFTAVLGLSALMSPFVELGGYTLIVRDVHQRNMSLRAAIERSIEISLAVFPLVFLVVLALKPLLFPTIPWVFVVSITIAELLGNRVIALFYGLNVARGRLQLNTLVESVAGISRLLLVLLLAGFHGNANLWSALYLLQAAVLSIGIIVYLVRHLGMGLRLRLPDMSELRDSMHFAFGSAAQVAYNELDKVMLARLSTLADTGLFSSASRIVNLTTLPLFAVTASIYPKFFNNKNSNPYEVAFRILPFTFLYGVVAAGIIIFLSPFLSKLLGNGFSDVDQAIKILAIISIFNAIHYPVADSITGGGKQHFRTQVYVISLIINVSLNMYFIPQFGWRGAAYSTLITQVLLVTALLCYAYKQMRGRK